MKKFSDMPDSAKLWVIAAAEPLDQETARALLSRVDSFVSGWLAHGAPVVGARDWREGRFLLIAADEQATGVSGCSIDALFRVLKEAETDLGVSLLDSSLVYYRDAAGEVRSATRAEFRDLVGRGEIGAETRVFDNTVRTVGALRGGRWERAAAEAWHARAFGIGEMARS